MKCILCWFRTLDRQKFQQHTHCDIRGSVHDDKCPQCNETLESYFQYLKHLKEKHNGIPKHKCAECHDMFDNEKDLFVHHYKTHFEEIRKRPKSAPKKAPVEETSICDICGKSAKNMRSHHDYYHKKEEVICNECGHVSENQTRHKDHFRMKHNLVPCPHCGKMLPNQTLARHIQSRHTSTWDRKYKCKICSRGFTQPKRLEDHMNVHTGAKPHECQFCTARFSNKCNMYAHIRINHKGIKRTKKVLEI